MRISLIVAVSANDIIGVDGALPWHLPDDFHWFKAQTLGKPVAMGRKTFESLGRALPGRRNIVITRQDGYRADGADVADSPAAAVIAAGDAGELMVIGGGEIYKAFLPQASRIYLTRVEAVVEGDTRFPPRDPDAWALQSSEWHPPDDRHAHAFEFRVYDRP